MRARELEQFRKKLLVKRSELIEIVQKTENYGREADSSTEAMDKASSSYTKEFMFSKSGGERQLLQAVIDALDRIETKDYGDCLSCGELVERKRLKAVPWAALCLSCQEKAEGIGLKVIRQGS